MHHYIKYSLCFVLLFFTYQGIAQVNDLPLCEQLIKEYAPNFKAEDYDIYPFFCNYESVPSTKIDLHRYLNCLIKLANNGNEKAEQYFLEHSLDMFNYLVEKKKKKAFYESCFSEKLGELPPSEKAFETILIFFKENLLLSDERPSKKKRRTGHFHVNTHYGMRIYHNILFPMMSKENREFYIGEWYKLFREYELKYGEDTEENLEQYYHPIWYQRIKEDWEAGKIKLRSEK